MNSHRCSNDLQPAALDLDPGLRRTLRAGLEAGALAGICQAQADMRVPCARRPPLRRDVELNLTGEGVCRTVRVASGPVGARVVSS